MRQLLQLGAAIAVAGMIQAAPIVPVVSLDALALANALVAGNPGIIVDSATLTGDAEAGSFTGAVGLLPFDTGVFLSTGTAACIPGPNNDSGCTGNGASATLTINFTPTGNMISFQYVFGSEEYNEYVNQSFNDTFTFMLNGTNIALIPGTLNEVSIDNVNLGLNPAYFTDNEGGAIDLQYDGFAGLASALFASGNVNPGVMNTLVISITDQGDTALDSGVFLAGGSLIDAPPPTPDVPEPSTIVLGAAGLLGLAVMRRKRA